MLVTRGKWITPGYTPYAYKYQVGHSVPWWFVIHLSELTDHVKYECDFDANGICREYRQRDFSYYGDNPDMCFCQACAASVGHHQCFPVYSSGFPDDFNSRSLKSMARRFDDDTGFWRKDKGYILPREYRSITCLTYQCGNVKDTLDKQLLLMLKNYNIVKEFRKFEKFRAEGYPHVAISSLERRHYIEFWHLRHKQEEEKRAARTKKRS